MVEMNGNEALILGVIVALVLLVAWWILRRKPERIRAESVDVLTPGAAPAERNTLLVEAPPAAEILGGVGLVVEAAAAEEIAAAAEVTAVSPAGDGDDLSRIKGLGPKLRSMLAGLGITRFEQIAQWTADDIARIDPQLGAFQGRIERDSWVEQARYLAAGDLAGFEARFGKV